MTTTSDRRRPGQRLAMLAVLALLYYAAARFGFHLANLHPSASPVWAPTGIALAALLIGGFELWPAVAAGAFWANWANGLSIPASLAITAGNTLEALVGASLVNRWANGSRAFDAPPTIFRYTVLAAILGTAISATFGAVTLTLDHEILLRDFWPLWMTWWLGNASGALVVGSFILVWRNRPDMTRMMAHPGEAMGLAAALLTTGWVVFMARDIGPVPAPRFICVPIVIWAAFRFGRHGSVTATLLLASVAAFSALWHPLEGPADIQNAKLLLNQLLMAILACTGAAVAAARDQTRQAQDSLYELNHALERRVRERTAEVEKKNEELLRTRNLEALGRLAGGIAHDFNNLLTGIRGVIEELREALGSSSPHRADLDAAQEAVSRAGLLTRQLLAFGRRQVITPHIFEVNSVIRTMEPVLRRLIREDIALHFELAPGLPAVEADPGQMEQVLMNLILNSRDAMPAGGTLLVNTALAPIGPEDLPERTGSLCGPCVIIQVCDTGAGMSEDIVQHIFEPFYTTKEQGEGSGLGLATVYGIVQQNGGHIRVHSRLGQGTEFTLFWPAALGKQDGASGHAAVAGLAAHGGTETILVAEDERIVRLVVERTLRARGYKVLTAADGPRAMAELDAYPGQVHLLLTDVVMPGMNGKELADRVSVRHPGIQVLFMSGHPESVIAEHGILAPGVHYLEKSFSPDQLAHRVREVLDTSKPRSRESGGGSRE